ncbi:MAG TPA: hypothetical protein DHV36_15480 [Desulfobacteraceae bacterium]|nr:hypothetical protein [Desulfobacteraceae bacterium]
MENALNDPLAQAVPPAAYLPDHPIFETDLYIPKYMDGRWGDWEIRTAKLVLDHGYHTGMWMVRDLAVLLKHGKSGTTLPDSWMSPSAHEIESQELGCRNAFGHTVIMGLGMGWCAINSALNPAVEKVTVIELDPVVIDLVAEMDVIAQAPPEAGDKIRVIHGDALNWEPDLPVDFLYADIWRSLAESGTLDQMRRMQSNIKASQIYFWGQELIIYNEAVRQWPDLAVVDNAYIKKCIDEVIDLPLLIPSGQDYGAMIERIVQNRHSRGLPLER